MSSSRHLKSKIKSVRNIKQITKAVQMVSATKMRRSQEVALNARPYAKKSFILLSHLLKYSETDEKTGVLWQKNKNKKCALVVITSDKGLAGNFNSSSLRSAWQWKNTKEEEGFEVDIVTVGRKARDFFRTKNANIVAEFANLGDLVSFEDTKNLSHWVLDNFKNNEYGSIFVCSNQFISALLQKVGIHQVLPLDKDELQKTIDGIVPKTGKYSEIKEEAHKEENNLSYLLEPAREEIMGDLSENLIRIMIMHFIFESNASEHSARMLAMKNATENAGRLQEELTLKLNKARQAGITQELTEIATAKEALTNN